MVCGELVRLTLIRRENTLEYSPTQTLEYSPTQKNRGESCGLALKGERLQDLKKRAGAGVKKKMKAVREAFRTHYMAQEEAKKRLPRAYSRGEDPLLCRTKSAKERIVVKLYDDVAPLATKNFIMLANGVQGERGRIKIGKGGKPLSYENVPFHRVVMTKNLSICQGGDITMHNGSGGEPAINNGRPFKDDRAALALSIDRRGLLCMCNTGKNTNTSQFFFTFGPQPKLKGKHVVFGEIIKGMEVLERIEKESRPDEKFVPQIPVVVVDSGVLS